MSFASNKSLNFQSFMEKGIIHDQFPHVCSLCRENPEILPEILWNAQYCTGDLVFQRNIGKKYT